MISTVEKVLILKIVPVFANIPDETLADVSSILEEVDVPAGRTIFEKGEAGTCMYIIVDGKVRVHDGDLTLNYLGSGDVFGEMAVLDAMPRSASVTALDDTHLLRLDQDALYELMADHVEVARGIIRVLSGYLRARSQDLADLNARLKNQAGAGQRC